MPAGRVMYAGNGATAAAFGATIANRMATVSAARRIMPDKIAQDAAVRPRPEIPSEIEDFRDTRWCREGARQVISAQQAERFIEQVGFAFCLTDSRRPGPSLYVAVCG